MTEKFRYQDYVTDETFLTKYNEWQKKFRTEARECDKVIVRMVAEASHGRSKAKLLDIGCSTGNLLLHLHRAMPELELTGGDLAESSLEAARGIPELAGVQFETLSILDLPPTASFDIVVVNAVLYMMTDEQFEAALASIHRTLVPGGALIIYDFFHPFPQRIAINEKSDSHPDGLSITFRPDELVGGWLRKHGFDKIVFSPFTLPIDMPKSDAPGLPTYTVKTADGARLPFRGALFQPWCHMSAEKRENGG